MPLRLSLSAPHVLFVLVLLALGYLVLTPLFFVLRTSVTPDTLAGGTDLTLKNYVDVFTSADLPELLRNSLVLGLGSSLVALPIGTLFAWIVSRTNTPLKWLAYGTAYTSLAIPGIIRAIGWILLLGPQAGLLNLWARDFLGIPVAFDVFTMPGMILVEGLGFVPLAFLLMVGPLRTMDPSLEESAVMSGAGTLGTLRHVTVKLAHPSVISVITLTFVTAIEAFDIPALIGIPGGVRVLTTQIYLSIVKGFTPRYGAASAYGVVLIILVVIALWYYARVTRQANKYATITGKGMRTSVMDLGRWRILTLFALILMPVTMGAPILVLLFASLLPLYEHPTLASLGTLTLKNYTDILVSINVVSALRNSILIAGVAATVTLGISAITAWLSVRSEVRGRSWLDLLASLTLVFPGITLGVALLKEYLTLPIPIYGTVVILMIAYTTKYLPFGMRFASPAVLRIGRELEESAQMSGVGWTTMFRRIDLPLMLPALIGGWIYVFLLSMKELPLALLLRSPGSGMLSTQMYDMWTNGLTTQIAAFGMLATGLLVICAIGFQIFAVRYGLSAR
jgi:iron(III) transport system permease protein